MDSETLQCLGKGVLEVSDHIALVTDEEVAWSLVDEQNEASPDGTSASKPL